MRTVLLISHRTLDEAGGRPQKLATRKRLLSQYGWEQRLAYVHNSFTFSVPRAIVRYTRIARSEDVDVINGVSSPPQLQIVGLAVSALSGVPYLAEFRDPLVDVPEIDPGSLSGRLRRVLESLIVRQADQIVWGDGIQTPDDYFDRKYGDTVEPKWYKLPFLGYESSRFDPVEPAAFDRFTITYAGSFYEGWIEPFAFLEGFRQFIDEHELSSDDARCLVYGDWSDAYTATVDDLGLADYVDTNDFIPHEELIPILKGSDVMLYIGGDDPRNRLSVPSKIWDYLGSGNPILAVVDPEFRAAEFVRGEGVGLIAPPSKSNAIANALEIFYRGKFDRRRQHEIQERFTRRRKIREFAGILDATFDGTTVIGQWDG